MRYLLFLSTLLCWNYAPATASSRYFFFCSLSRQTVVEMNMTVGNDGTKSFALLSDDGSSRRSLRTDALDIDQSVIDDWGALSETEREAATTSFRIMSEGNNTLLDEDIVSWKRINARECPCVSHFNFGETFYCEANRGYCAIPSAYYGDSADPVCLDIQNKEVFVRSVWPIILIWFALTTAFCILTFSGRNAMDYTLTSIFPKWNEMIFDAICHDPETNSDDNESRPGFLRKFFYARRFQFQNRYRAIVHRAQVREDGGNPDDAEGMAYEIRTRRFHKGVESEDNAEPDSMVHSCDTSQEDEESEESCSICFLPLQDGDRVGVIDCEHVFHVHCLKGWVSRRNVCPLCMQEGVAKPGGMTRRSVTTTESATDNS